jgi:hypothetical protein
MTRTVALHLSEPLLRRAVCRFWSRAVGWGGTAAFVFAVAMFSYLLAKGDRSWEIGVFGTLLLLMVGTAAALYFVHYRAAVGKLRLMKIPEVTVEMTPERLKITADSGVGELIWPAIKEVWRFDEVWLLFLSRAQFITFPLADLDAETREFILERVRSGGGKIK